MSLYNLDRSAGCHVFTSPPHKTLSQPVRLVWCLRSLSGLAACGLQLDKYGLLQLSSPNLADVLSTLLGVVLVLRAYVRSTVRLTVGSSAAV